MVVPSRASHVDAARLLVVMGCASSAADADASHKEPPTRARAPMSSASSVAHTARASASSTASVSYQVRLRGGPLSQEDYNARLSGVVGAQRVEVRFTSDAGVSQSYVVRYATCSQRGYYPEAPEKMNQDAFVATRRFREREDEHVFGVFDGHGEFGTECARFAAERVPMEMASREFGDVAGYEDAFRATNAALRASKIDDSLSGTTGLIAHIKGREVCVVNVGDSRATMGINKRNDVGEVVGVDTVDLSSDQTPFRADECERVKKAGARVLTLDQLEGFKDPAVQCWGTEQDDDGDPPRLWAKNGMYPGTAFTRSIGDGVAERIGVIATPEVERIRLNKDTKAIVIASDGVFEFIPSENVIHAAMATTDPQQSAIALVVESYKLWLQYETRTDDITVIVILIEDFPDEPDEPKTPLKSVASVGALFNFPDRANALTSPLPTAARPRRRVMPTFTMQTRRSYRVVHPYGLPSDLSLKETGSLEQQMGDLCISSSGHKASVRAVLKTSFLFSGAPGAVLDDIMNAMYKKRVYKGDVVVTQNDRHSLRAFYVVESGTLMGRDNVKWVENEGDSKSEVETKEAVKMRSYGKGGDRMCFNEQCMAHAQMPHETVTAEEDGSLWVLDFTSYARIVRDVSESNVNELTRALRDVDALKTVSLSDLRRLASKVVDNRGKTLIRVRRDELIARQGQLLKALHVISTGNVACTVRANSRDESEQPRIVLKLRKGQHFGERALLSAGGTPCATNIKAIDDDVQVWRVSLADVTAITGLAGISRTASASFDRSGSPVMSASSASRASEPHERRLSFGDDDRASREALYMTLLGHMREMKGALKEATVQISLARAESLSRVDGVLRERAIITKLTSSRDCPEFIPTPSIPSKDASFISIPYPFVPRCALEAVIACGGGSKVEVVRYYVAALTLVLEYLHSMDVIFRGMDPETMPIDEHGVLRLTDFRFAKHLDVNDSAPGRTYTVCGVAAYMAPEVVRSTGHDERADWFSLGTFIAHLLRGTPPFGMRVAHQTYEAICACNLKDTFREGADPRATALARDLLVVDPEERLHTAKAVKQSALLRDIDWDTLATRRPPAEVEKLTRSAYKGRGVPPIRDATEPTVFDTSWVDTFMALDTIAP